MRRLRRFGLIRIKEGFDSFLRRSAFLTAEEVLSLQQADVSSESLFI